MFKIGDKVKLGGCPFDEQIAFELQEFIQVKDKVQTVTKVKKVTDPGTTGQWIKTNLMKKDWTDKAWFYKVRMKKKTKKIKQKRDKTDG